MRARTGGFTYVEMIIALAVFCIALAPLFPAISQARRNADYARETYRAQCDANEMVLIVKNALEKNKSPVEVVAEHMSALTNPPAAYGFWVRYADGAKADISYTTVSAPALSVQTDVSPAGLTGTGVIIAVVWDADGHPAGRAVGMVTDVR